MAIFLAKSQQAKTAFLQLGFLLRHIIPHLAVCLFSTTGHSTNFVCYFHLPSDVEAPFVFKSDRLKIKFSDIPICCFLKDVIICIRMYIYILYTPCVSNFAILPRSMS